MERNFVLVNKLIIMVCILSTIFLGCTQIKVTDEELVGIWKASDGAELALNADKTFSLKGFDPAHWKFEWKNKKHSFKIRGIGKWNIENRNAYNEYLILNLSFSDVMGDLLPQVYNEVTKEYFTTSINYTLEIRGSGFLGNRRPWIISSSSDDDFDFSEFKKVK